MNICEECQNTKVEEIPCYECKTGMMQGRWDSPSIIYTCMQCGASVVGDGFWYPCESDSEDYQVSILTDKLSAKQLLIIAKELYEPVLQVKKHFQRADSLVRFFAYVKL